MSETKVLEIQGLVRHFTRSGFFGRNTSVVRAVDGVSLAVRAGRTMGLVGESGCGKSTLIRTTLGLEKATAGRVLYRGANIYDYAPAEMQAFRRKVQMIFQDPFASLNPRMSVGDLVSEGWIINRDVVPKHRHRERVLQLLDQVGLRRDFMDRYPHELSGGQRQRVGIARALALEPEILICDEPVSALDVSVQAQVMNLLKDLQQDLGLSLLFVSHNLSVIRHISDDIAVMYLGRVVEQGKADDIFAAPEHPYTAALISASPRLHNRGGEPIELIGDPPDPAKFIAGCQFNTRCWRAQSQCREIRPERESGREPGHLRACHFPMQQPGSAAA